MIEIKNLHKYFEQIHAVNNLTLTIPDGTPFGILGVNGAGKSTLLRLISGILKPEQGEITIDGCPIYDSAEAKSNLFYLSDNPYFYPNASVDSLKWFYANLYPNFDCAGFDEMIRQLNLDPHRKLRTFSKGMKRQAFICAALSSNAKYLFCDEIFDGLDPLVSRLIHELLMEEMEYRKLTLVIASHNLRHLEHICKHIAIINQGSVLLSKELKALSGDILKFQCVFSEDEEAYLKEHLSLSHYEKCGAFVTFLARGEEAALREIIMRQQPIYCGTMALSLEEIFLGEMEKNGYDISKSLF